MQAFGRRQITPCTLDSKGRTTREHNGIAYITPQLV